MARVLFLGSCFPASTSGQRAGAIKRRHDVIFRDPYKAFEKSLTGARGVLHFRTGFVLLQNKMVKWLAEAIENLEFKPELIWVDHGELFGPACVKVLKKLNCPVVLYNVDDPTGKRDGARFKSLINAIPFYDIIAVVRKETAEECEALGGKHVVRVFRSYDEEAHKPFSSIDEISEKYRSDVAFIGTWMRHEKRDEFLLKLIELGVPVSIFGDRWHKSPHYSKLESHLRSGQLEGRNYVAAIQGAKICIGLLSKGNRDLHTTRSLEIPFAGGLFCAQRTVEHQELYQEGVEAVFWSDAEECARICKRLLEDETLRENIRKAGMKRVRSINVGNEDIFNEILMVALGKHSKVASSI